MTRHAAAAFWAHRPVGRGLITLAIALLGAATLLLDAAAPAATAPGGALVAWHALSTVALLGLAAWALWAPQLPPAASRALTAAAGGLLLGAFAVAAQQLPGGGWHAVSGAGGATLLLAGSLYVVGWRWARQEIRW